MPAGGGRQSPSGAADGHPRMPKACGRGIPAALGTGSVRTCTPERGGCRCRRRTETIILPFYEKDTFIALFCGCRAGCAGRGTVYARGAAVRTSGDAAGHRRPGAATGLASGRQPFRALQRAYRVVVGRDSAAVAAGCGDVWDSGRTDSDGMLVRYAGPKLDPFTRYYWAVTVWDKDYARSSSGVAAFETGMMGGRELAGMLDQRPPRHKP